MGQEPIEHAEQGDFEDRVGWVYDDREGWSYRAELAGVWYFHEEED